MVCEEVLEVIQDQHVFLSWIGRRLLTVDHHNLVKSYRTIRSRIILSEVIVVVYAHLHLRLDRSFWQRFLWLCSLEILCEYFSVR